MAYRFVLDVPEAAHEDAKAAIYTVRDAQVLIDRHPNPATAGPVVTEADVVGSRAELTVTAHSLNVIDALYNWMAGLDEATANGIYVEAHKGARLHLVEYTAPELRRLIQGDQYWFENTVPQIHYPPELAMEGGALVSDVPYGGRSATSAVAVPAENRVELGRMDHIAIRVRVMTRAEAWYRDYLGMDVMYRAFREGERWQHLPASYDYIESIQTGVYPEIVRMENGPIGIVLIYVGAAAIMHENRVAYVSVDAPIETLNALRGRVLFASYTVLEDSPRAFRFVDPFGVTWQIVAS
jgi:catechol 2,3-dioxygenase-like lactoylglutathione lyase family enzyme